MKSKSITASWIYNGTTFIKEKPDEKPVKVMRESDLEKYLRVKVIVNADVVKRHLQMDLSPPQHTQRKDATKPMYREPPQKYLREAGKENDLNPKLPIYKDC